MGITKLDSLIKKRSQVVTQDRESFPVETRPDTEIPKYQHKINLLDQNGMNELHWAIRRNNIEEVKGFIENGGDINTRDKHNVPPVTWAFSLNRVEILFLLISAGADIPADLNVEVRLTERDNYYSENAKLLSKELKSWSEPHISLAFSYCIESIAKDISKLDMVTHLSLPYNNLTAIPSEIFSMRQLHTLNISNNLLITIPEQIGELPQLRAINFSNNVLNHFPGSDVSGTEQWTSVDVSHNQITALPTTISKFYRLIHLNCSHNFLTEVPKSIVEILGLTTLNLSHNRITALRDIPIHLWLSLISLDLSFNQLQTIPHSDIMTSATIREFHFKQNRLPTELFRILRCYFQKEESLDLSSLSLTTVLPELRLLTHLKELNLSNNDFVLLPNEIGHLTELTSLDLSYNRFTDLPLYIHRLSNLQTLNLDETRSHIENPPKAVIDRGLKTLMGHYFDLLQGEPCYRLKLMIVGQENVGKSTLLHALKTHKLRRRTKRSNISTDGIDIERWVFKTPQKLTLTFSAWDFAGQEIYYATHALFLSSNAIYLIVFDMRHHNESRVEFWLNSVASRATGAPVVLVGTHLDDPMFENNDKQLTLLTEIHEKFKTRFPNIQNIIAVSASEFIGIQQVLEILGNTASKIPNIRIPLPRIYQNLEELIFDIKDKENPPAVHWDRYVTLASTMNFNDEDQLLRATRFLNDLGSLVFFEDEKTADKLVVLDPQWLTSMFASVITTSHTYIKNGILRKSNINQIWRPPQYPLELHTSLISLLQQFDIIYELPDYNGEECFLIPSLLPEEKPPIDLLWLDYTPDLIQFVRHYTLDFIPNGFFAKFMVRFLNFTDTPLKFWRTGVLAARQSAKAFIELIDTTVYITVRGETGAELLRIATEIVDTLANSFFKVKIRKAVVPCPHCLLQQYQGVEREHKEPYMFNLWECEQAAARLNARVMTCKHDQSQIRLDSLVPDIAMTDFEGSQINYNEIELEKSIGKGAFGEIFRASWKGETVAVKRLKVDEDSMAVEAFSEFRREVWLMSGLRHPCIVNLKGFSTAPLSMIMECVTGGDLFGFIHNESIDLDWHLRVKIAADMAYGMAFLHGITPPLLHRDLKSPNVLVMGHQPGTQVIAKVADFGLSSRLFVDTLSDRAVENPTWCAPEVLQKKPYTEKADVYSYGMMLWELLTRELPFDNYKFQYQVEDDVIKGVRPSIPDNCWEDYRDLITACWHADPEKRPSFELIIRLLKDMVKANLGGESKLKYPFNPCGTEESTSELLASGTSKDKRASKGDSSSSSSSTSQAQDSAGVKLQGVLMKKIETDCKRGISAMQSVTNQVWCVSLDSTVHIYSAESGRHLTSYESQQGELHSICTVNDLVWTGGSSGVVVSWSVEDLVTVEAYDVKIRTGILFLKQEKKRSFSSNKAAPRTCSLLKSGFFKIFKADQLILDIFLQGTKVEVVGKSQFVMIEASGRQTTLQAKSDEEAQSWVSDISLAAARFSTTPSAQQAVRRLHNESVPISCMQYINDNSIFIGTGSSIRVVDYRLRAKIQIRLETVISQNEIMVNDLIDNDGYIWAAVNNRIVRINSVTCKIINALAPHHNDKINALLKVGDEVWAAANDAVTVWDAQTGEYKSELVKKPKVSWLCMDRVGDNVWIGSNTGVIYVFDSNKTEKGQLKQHKGEVTCLKKVLGGLIWSCSTNEICIWK